MCNLCVCLPWVKLMLQTQQLSINQWEECVQPVCMSAVGQTNVTNTAALNKKAGKSNHASNGFRLFCSVSLVNVLKMYSFISKRPFKKGISGITVIEFARKCTKVCFERLRSRLRLSLSVNSCMTCVRLNCHWAVQKFYCLFYWKWQFGRTFQNKKYLYLWVWMAEW